MDRQCPSCGGICKKSGCERENVEPVRIRIMQTAYDLADSGDSEGYNAVKVLCSDVLEMLREKEK